MTDPKYRAVLDAIKQLPIDRPKPLMRIAERQLEDDALDPISEEQLIDLLTPGDENDPVQRAFHQRLDHWNAEPELDERVPGGITDPNTSERHEQIYTTLELTPASVQRLQELFVLTDLSPTVVARKPEWEEWYDPATMQNHYWPRYKAMLEGKAGFDADAIVGLDRATTEVVRRLANPTDPEVWQTRGLVVGHVQSGKTANFTGVLAKAIDAGYKLIIVLTGTHDILRSQTQKRLDMELVGRENILQGTFQDYLAAERDLRAATMHAERADAEARLAVAAGTSDYASTGDSDWDKGKFLQTPQPLDEIGAPWITRLTNNQFDYKALRTGIDALEFQNNLMVPSRPLHAPENIGRVPVRLAVMKKNSTVLKRLAEDLARIRAKLEDVPTLIIDDEADQASINTKRDKRPAGSEADKERTRINEHISTMLSTLPRSQYVAYTATPFANVLVDIDDTNDIFPKDFILSLTPSPSYMGAKELHDLDPPIDDSPEYSNKAAYHRPVPMDDGTEEEVALVEALDAFVLTGATKLLRQERGFGEFHHHTMLVHETQKTSGHEEIQAELEHLWRKNGYSLPSAKKRLRRLWDEDFLDVSAVRAEKNAPVPTFDELWPYVGAAIRKIEEGASPVVPVNGTKDSDYVKEDIAFERRDVWKILVGGAKLSRGFTVEGLTVSVFTRVTLAADTLMQMGRWFGYRGGYRDLVRIYLGTGIPRRGVPGGVDLYDAFTSIARDEEDFRIELSQYEGFNDDGSPKVLPIDVPPLVTQRLPWLKPTASNKMYNSHITSKGIGGKTQDLALQADRGDGSGNRLATTAALEILRSLEYSDGTVGDTFLSDGDAPFPAYYGVVPAQVVLDLFDAMPWAGGTPYAANRGFFESSMKSGKLQDFGVVVPSLISDRKVLRGFVDGYPDLELGIITRSRRTGDRDGFSGSSRRQRPAIERIAMSPDAERQGGALAGELSGPARGGLLLAFSGDFSDPTRRVTDLSDGSTLAPEDVAVHMSIAFPYASAPKGVIVREVERQDRPDEAFVPVRKS